MREQYANKNPRIELKLKKKLSMAKFQMKQNKKYELLRITELKVSIETGHLNSFIAKRLPFIIQKQTKILNELSQFHGVCIRNYSRKKSSKSQGLNLFKSAIPVKKVSSLQ